MTTRIRHLVPQGAADLAKWPSSSDPLLQERREIFDSNTRPRAKPQHLIATPLELVSDALNIHFDTLRCKRLRLLRDSVEMGLRRSAATETPELPVRTRSISSNALMWNDRSSCWLYRKRKWDDRA